MTAWRCWFGHKWKDLPLWFSGDYRLLVLPKGCTRCGVEWVAFCGSGCPGKWAHSGRWAEAGEAARLKAAADEARMNEVRRKFDGEANGRA